MTVPRNPVAMCGWFSYRHIPYPPGSPAWHLARDIKEVRLAKKEFFEVVHLLHAFRPRLDPRQPLFECCAGHGLAGMLLAMEGLVPQVTFIDRHFPPNQERLLEALTRYQPQLPSRLRWVESSLEAFPHFGPGTLLAAHACGPATDAVLEAAVKARARFFVMPCCISRREAQRFGVERKPGFEQEVNARRVEKVELAGYRVRYLSIDARITPFHTVLHGWPEEETELPGQALWPGGQPPPPPLPLCLPPSLGGMLEPLPAQVAWDARLEPDIA